MTWGTTGDFQRNKGKKDKNKNNKKHTTQSNHPRLFPFPFFIGLCAILLSLRTENEKRGKTTAHDYGFIISASHDPVSVLFFEKSNPMMTEIQRGDRVTAHRCGSLQTNHWMVFDGNSRGLRWSTKGVMNEWRSGRILVSWLVIFLFLSNLCSISSWYTCAWGFSSLLLSVFAFPGFVCISSPFLCTGFLFLRLLLRSGRRANGIAREGKGQRGEGSGGNQIFLFFVVVWMTLRWCLFFMFSSSGVRRMRLCAKAERCRQRQGNNSTCAKKTTNPLGNISFYMNPCSFSSFFLDGMIWTVVFAPSLLSLSFNNLTNE